MVKADIALIKRWQKTQDPMLLSQITEQIKPIVYGATNKWSGVLPDYAMRARAMQLAIDSLRSYDESKGSITTYLYSRLQKISRDVYTAQNAIRIPEGRATKIGTLRAAEHDLTVKLGRDPYDSEIADELIWNVSDVNKLRGMARPELAYESGQDIYGPSGTSPDFMSMVKINYAYNQLSERDKNIFNYLTGQHGRPELKPAEIEARLGVTQSTISRVRHKVMELI